MNKRKKADKTSGRKCPRPGDVEVIPAADAAADAEELWRLQSIVLSQPHQAIPVVMPTTSLLYKTFRRDHLLRHLLSADKLTLTYAMAAMLKNLQCASHVVEATTPSTGFNVTSALIGTTSNVSICVLAEHY